MVHTMHFFTQIHLRKVMIDYASTVGLTRETLRLAALGDVATQRDSKRSPLPMETGMRVAITIATQRRCRRLYSCSRSHDRHGTASNTWRKQHKGHWRADSSRRSWDRLCFCSRSHKSFATASNARESSTMTLR